MLITGMSAGFAGLFRTLFAATTFAMEVLTAGGSSTGARCRRRRRAVRERDLGPGA